MRQWNVRYGLDFLDLENTQIGLPLMELIQRIMIGAEILRQCLRVNGPAEHPAQGHAVHNTAVNGPRRDCAVSFQRPHRSVLSSVLSDLAVGPVWVKTAVGIFAWSAFYE